MVAEVEQCHKFMKYLSAIPVDYENFCCLNYSFVAHDIQEPVLSSFSRDVWLKDSIKCMGIAHRTMCT